MRKTPSSRHLRPREGRYDQHPSKEERELSFANEGQFLLVSLASLEDVSKRLIFSETSTCKSETLNQSKILFWELR